jgi:hypothetical protein
MPDGIGSATVPMSSVPPGPIARVPRQVSAVDTARENLSPPLPDVLIPLLATVVLLVSSPYVPAASSKVTMWARTILCPAPDGGLTPPTQVAPALHRPAAADVYVAIYRAHPKTQQIARPSAEPANAEAAMTAADCNISLIICSPSG